MGQAIRYFLDGLSQLQQALAGSNGVATTTGVTVFDVNGGPIATGNALPVSDAATEANTAQIQATSLSASTALGTPADAIWSGSGNASAIAALKAIWASLAANGSSSTLGVTTGTLIKASAGRTAKVTVIVAGTTAGSLNDCATIGAVAQANQVLAIPANAPVGTVYSLDWPHALGIVLTPGASGTLAIAWH